MSRFSAFLLLFFPLAVPGQEIASPRKAAKPLFFHLRVGADPARTITGRLEASGDAGLDTARLDLDGDGAFETERRFRESVHPRSKAMTRDSRIHVRHQGVVWSLELDALRSPAKSREIGAGTTTVHWAASADGLRVRFQDSPLTLHPTLEASRAAPAFRMGPPLRFETGTSSRGPHAVVTATLRDGNGGKVSSVYRGKKAERPVVEVLAAEEVRVTGRPGYS
jgi:hypothetical protein